MGLFNKLFRGAPRIGLSDEDRGAAKIADDVLSRAGHLSRSMERSGVLDPSMQKSRLFGSVALGGAVVGSGAAAHSIAFDNQNTFGNTAGGAGAGAMIGLAASVALGARRGRQGKLVGSKDAFAHAAVTGQNYKPISFSDSVFGESKVLAKEAKEAFENQENYSNAARMFYEQSLAKGQEPTKFQRTMSSAWEHTKNAYRQVPKQFNNAKNMAGNAFTGAKNKAGSVYRQIPDYLEKVHSKIDMDLDIKSYGDFSLSVMRSPHFKKFDNFVRNRKQPNQTVSSSINEKNAKKYDGVTHSSAAAKVFGNDGPRFLALPNKTNQSRTVQGSAPTRGLPQRYSYDMHNPERTTYSKGRKIDWYDRMFPFGLNTGIRRNAYEGPIQTSTPEHLAKSSARRRHQPTSPNFTKYSRYEDKPFMTKGEAELGKPIGPKNKTQRYKSFTHTTNTLEPTGKTTKATRPSKHKYKRPTK